MKLVTEPDAAEPRVVGPPVGRCPEIDHDLMFVFDRCRTCSGTGFIELRARDDKDREHLRRRFADHLVHAIARELRRPVSDIWSEARRLGLEGRGPAPESFVRVRSLTNDPPFGKKVLR